VSKELAPGSSVPKKAARGLNAERRRRKREEGNEATGSGRRRGRHLTQPGKWLAWAYLLTDASSGRRFDPANSNSLVDFAAVADVMEVLGLARGVIAGGDFAARLVKFALHIIGQFKVIFHIIIEPSLELFQLRPREFGDGGLDFLDCTHGRKIPKGPRFAQAAFLLRRYSALQPKRTQ